MKIVNIIDDAQGNRLTRRDEIEGIMVHRAGINLQSGIILGVSAPELVDVFTGRNPRFPAVTEVTGRKNPYTLYIGGHREADGIVWQAIPLNEVSPHSRRWSYSYIGIACIGDFRYEEPTPVQRNTLVDLLAGLCAAFAFDPYRAIRGHGEVQAGDKAKGAPEACPGDMMDMNSVRYDTEQVMKERACRALAGCGIVF